MTSRSISLPTFVECAKHVSADSDHLPVYVNIITETIIIARFDSRKVCPSLSYFSSRKKKFIQYGYTEQDI